MTTKPRKFRFQLFHQWIVENYRPLKVLDVGGGKGLLSYLLNQSGFEAAVLDPKNQLLPWKYKDLQGKRNKIKDRASVKRIDQIFNEEKAKSFDLIVALHAHGANMKIIEFAKKYDKLFAILPCCVIDEPIVKRKGVNWFDSLVDFSREKGHNTDTFKLDFKGKNRGIYNY